MNRRTFLRGLGLGAVALVVPSISHDSGAKRGGTLDRQKYGVITDDGRMYQDEAFTHWKEHPAYFEIEDKTIWIYYNASNTYKSWG